jgi:hypothetical protein
MTWAESGPARPRLFRCRCVVGGETGTPLARSAVGPKGLPEIGDVSSFLLEEPQRKLLRVLTSPSSGDPSGLRIRHSFVIRASSLVLCLRAQASSQYTVWQPLHCPR